MFSGLAGVEVLCPTHSSIALESTSSAYSRKTGCCSAMQIAVGSAAAPAAMCNVSKIAPPASAYATPSGDSSSTRRYCHPRCATAPYFTPVVAHWGCECYSQCLRMLLVIPIGALGPGKPVTLNVTANRGLSSRCLCYYY